MKKHPLLFNFIFTMAIQIGVYLIEIFEVQIIEPMLQAMGVRSEGILPPTAVVSLIVFSAVLIAAAIAAGVIRSKVYFWIPSFLLIFIGLAIYYPDNLARIKENNIINLPLIAEHLGYGSIMYSAICIAVAKFLFQLLPYTITRIIKQKLEARNNEIRIKKGKGATVTQLSDEYYLSEDAIKRILDR